MGQQSEKKEIYRKKLNGERKKVKKKTKNEEKKKISAGRVFLN